MVEDQIFQFHAIISALIARTREGRIDWEWDEDLRSATATLEHGRIIISVDRDFDTVVEIQNTDLENVDQINVGYPQYTDLTKVADELYQLARRSALRVDSTLESILREIST